MKLVLMTFILVSCSIPVIKTQEQDITSFKFKDYQYYSPEDFVDHLKQLGEFYLSGSKVKKIRISPFAKKYLSSIISKIVVRNELFYEQDKKSKFVIIKDNNPFHFSLPDREIILSSGLINKYIKHEGILASIISYELVRSEKLVYGRKVLIPTGYISTRKFINLLRVPLKDKVEIHKWAFHTLKRAGFDYDHYLGWIQIQNRNNLDFNLLLGELPNIAREESLFKSFLIKNSKSQNKDKRKINSSRAFYRFIKELGRKS